MTLFLDSASADDARTAAKLGFVGGATTNPALLAQAGLRADEAVAALCDYLPGTVFHQLVSPTSKERRREARWMLELRPGKVGLKIACTPEGLALAGTLAKEGHTVGVTAVFHPAQAVIACAAGARYVLPYVNRTTRLGGDGLALVRSLRRVVDRAGTDTEIIAASLKEPNEAVEALLSGAHHLTLPLAVIEAMIDNDLTRRAVSRFREAADSGPADEVPPWA